jgi:hypothetical protein
LGCGEGRQAIHASELVGWHRFLARHGELHQAVGRVVP